MFGFLLKEYAINGLGLKCYSHIVDFLTESTDAYIDLYNSAQEEEAEKTRKLAHKYLADSLPPITLIKTAIDSTKELGLKSDDCVSSLESQIKKIQEVLGK